MPPFCHDEDREKLLNTNFLGMWKKWHRKNGSRVWTKRKTEAVTELYEPKITTNVRKWIWFKIISHPKTLWTTLDEVPNEEDVFLYAAKHDILKNTTHLKTRLQIAKLRICIPQHRRPRTTRHTRTSGTVQPTSRTIPRLRMDDKQDRKTPPGNQTSGIRGN